MALNNNKRPIEKEPYYHGWLARVDIEEILKNEGDFLVNTAKPQDGEPLKQVLAVCCEKDWNRASWYKHFVILSKKGKYFVTSKYSFDSIVEMVEYLKASKDPLLPGCVAKTPINRPKWVIDHESIVVQKKVEDRVRFGEYHTGTYKMRNGKTIDVSIRKVKFDKLTREQHSEFMNDARVLRELCHPNIIKFYGVAAMKDPLYVVTELPSSDGRLDTYLYANPNLPMSKCDEMCLQAAWALEYLHSNEYIHREPTAENFVYHNGQVKLADFRRTVKGTCYLPDGKEMAQVRYMAPDLFKGYNSVYTYKTDVWTFGLLCWEIYNPGKQSFAEIAKYDIPKKIGGGHRMQMQSSVNSDIADVIVNKCWAFNQNDRPSMSEICRMLQMITGIPRPNFEAYAEQQKIEKKKMDK